jgi:large subunit ribosomal protein L7e
MQVEKSKQKAAAVPESVLKKQARDEKLRADRAKARVDRKKRNQERRTLYTQRAQQYQKEYADQDRSLVQARREAKAKGGFFAAPEAKVLLVVRIRGINRKTPDCKKILQLLRLRQIHNAVFIKVNKATINMLRKVEPYLTYGYPTRDTIKRLIYKRGFGKVNRQRIPLTSNEIIEQSLGKFGVNCIEDVIHSIVTVDSNFKRVSNFLWPIKLRPPRGGFSNKRHPYQVGGDWGNREEQINQLVRRML